MSKLNDLVHDHLISTGLVTGIALLTNETSNCSFIAGEIDKIDQDWKAFITPFNNEKDVPNLTLKIAGGTNIRFTVFKRTECSIYGISEGTKRCVIVCNYPNGVMIGICPGSPNIISKAVPLLESFVSTLR